MNQLMKRVLSVLLVVCLLCSALPSAFAAEGGGFTDVSKDHWAYDAITEAVAAGYFKGVSDTAFDPEGTLTRAMLVTVLARAAGAETDDNASTGFSDVAVGTWYTGAVAWAAENGVVTGDGDGTFAPDRAATRQETATIFLRLLWSFIFFFAGSDFFAPAHFSFMPLRTDFFFSLSLALCSRCFSTAGR